MSEFIETPPEIVEIAKAAIEKLLPTKSSVVYEAAFKKILRDSLLVVIKKTQSFTRKVSFWRIFRRWPKA